MKKHNFYCSSIALFLITILLSSCNLFSVSLEDFFKEYTESAVVEDYELDCPTRTDKFGNICIPSDTDVTFNFLLRNPQNYRDITITYILNNDTSTALSKGPSLTVAQNYADARQADYIWSKTDLVSAEKQNIHDLSGIVSVYRPTTGQTFTEYPFNIHVNSAPPAVKNPTLQLDAQQNGKYVLCFYMPKTSGTVHEKDTKIFKIGDNTWYFKADASAFYTDAEMTSQDTVHFDSTLSPSSLYDLGDSYKFGGSEKCPSGYQTWYYITGEAISTTERKYDISIIDDAGLTSSIGVSNQGYQLEPVTLKISDSVTKTYEDLTGTSSPSADENTAKSTIQINHSGKTTNNKDCGPVQVEYTITKTGFSKSGTVTVSADSPAYVEVPFGKDYTITASTKKNYYIESNETKVTGFKVLRSNEYYVSNSGRENALGSKVDPFRTVQQAIASIDQLETDGVSSYTDYYINLLSDITPDASDYVPGSPNEFAGDDNSMIEFYLDKTIYLNGNGHTIDAQRSVDYEGRVITISYTKLHLTNIKITGGYKSPGSAIYCDTANIPLYLETGTIITGNINKNTTGCVIRTYYTINVSGIVKVYDNKNLSGNRANVYITDNHQLNITGPVTGSKIGITTQTEPRANNEGETNKERVYFATGLNQNSPSTLPSDVFFSDAGFTVGWGPTPVTPGDSRYCALWYSKGTINLEPIADLKITADNTTILKSQNSTAAQRTVTATARVNNQMVSPSSWYMELFCHGTSTGVTSNNNTITLGANWPNDTYTLFVKTVYNGQTYSAEINVDYTNAVVVNNVTEFNNALNSSGIIALSNNITEDTSNSETAAYAETNENISTYHIIDGKQLAIFGSSSGLVTNTENNRKIHSPDGQKSFFQIKGSRAKVVFNNIDFTVETNTRNNIKTNIGVIATALDNCEVEFNYCTVKNLSNNSGSSNGVLFRTFGSSKMTFNNCEFENINLFCSSDASKFVSVMKNEANCSAYFNNCTISNIGRDNAAQTDGCGAIINDGYLEIRGSSFSSCRAQSGGAVYNNMEMIIENTSFTDCWTAGINGSPTGGAIRISPSATSSQLKNCTFTYNKTYRNTQLNTKYGGGAIIIESGNVTLDSCTFTGNSCIPTCSTGNKKPENSYGGAVLISDYENNSSLINVTLKKNGSQVSVETYISTYMGGNTSYNNSNGNNIYIYKSKTNPITVNSQQYTSSQAWN